MGDTITANSYCFENAPVRGTMNLMHNGGEAQLLLILIALKTHLSAV